jgi:hypothetical protein
MKDFERIRQFVAHFGVIWIPKSFAENSLLPLWQTLKPHILTLARETLETVNLSAPLIRDAIIGAYDWPASAWGGDTVKSKVLHFFNVRLFVMWDEPMRRPYLTGSQGYLQFLEEMQIQVKESIKDFRQSNPASPSSMHIFLSKKLGYRPSRPLPKLVDQYNWITTTKRWPCSPPSWLLELYLK